MKINHIKLTGLSGFYQNLSNSSSFQKTARFFSRSNRSFTDIMALESVFLSGGYMASTALSDKIEKDQKPQMIINDTLTLGFSTAGAYLTDSKVKKLYGNFVEDFLQKHRDFYVGLNNNAEEKPLKQLLNMVKGIYEKKEKGVDITTELDKINKVMESKYHLKNIIGKEKESETALKAFQITNKRFKNILSDIKKSIVNAQSKDEAVDKVKKITSELYKSSGARTQANIVDKGFRSIRTLAIFGIIYRYIGPVFVTPIANWLSSMFFSNEEEY